MRIIETIKKYGLIFLIAIIVIGITIITVQKNKRIGIKVFENNNYTFNYDDNWSVTDENDLVVKLVNGDKATMNIELLYIDNEYMYYDMSDLIDDIVFKINEQNKEYKLISKRNDKVTKLSYNGYKLLYENATSQAMVSIVKSGDKVIIFNYEADNKYFDILLDSVQSIIYNFKIKPEVFEYDYDILINTSEITYSKNSSLEKMINKLKEYEMAKDNCYVNYSIPDIFRMKSFDSEKGLFDYKNGKKGEISLRTSLISSNIYDYLEVSSFTQRYESEKSDWVDKTNYNEEISEFNIGEYKGYIRKATYTAVYSSFMISYHNIESYTIVIALNKNRTLNIFIEGSDIEIPKKLIDCIKINSVKTYSSYITENINNGNMLMELKKFTNYDYNEYESLIVKVPSKYREIDKGYNKYSDRFIGLNYDFDNSVYQYVISYNFSEYSKDIQIDLINSRMRKYSLYGEIKKLDFVGRKIINGKGFSLYNASYYDNSKVYSGFGDDVIHKVNSKVLIYDLGESGCISITIDCNNAEIYDTLLSEVTNFDISINAYNNNGRR